MAKALNEQEREWWADDTCLRLWHCECMVRVLNDWATRVMGRWCLSAWVILHERSKQCCREQNEPSWWVRALRSEVQQSAHPQLVSIISGWCIFCIHRHIIEYLLEGVLHIHVYLKILGPSCSTVHLRSLSRQPPQWLWHVCRQHRSSCSRHDLPICLCGNLSVIPPINM